MKLDEQFQQIYDRLLSEERVGETAGGIDQHIELTLLASVILAALKSHLQPVKDSDLAKSTYASKWARDLAMFHGVRLGYLVETTWRGKKAYMKVNQK